MKEIEVSVVSIWRRDTQPNDIHYNDTQHNDEENTLLSITTLSITIRKMRHNDIQILCGVLCWESFMFSVTIMDGNYA